MIIVGRGGGSIEDLWAFNEECVAMAIFRCETPVISAVGHETDFTIADFVADLRAPTPSAAAELAVFEYDTFEQTLAMFLSQMGSSITRLVEREQKHLEQAQLLLKLAHPGVRLNEQKETLAKLSLQMSRQMKHLIEQKKAELSVAAVKLDAQSPLGKLGGGYAFVTDEKRAPLCSVKEIAPGQSFFAYLKDGVVRANAVQAKPFSRIEEAAFDGKEEKTDKGHDDQ